MILETSHACVEKENVMKVLVIEDKEIHCLAATETLVGHEVTIVRSFDEAMEILESKVDREQMARLLAEAGFPTAPAYGPEYAAYSEARDKAAAQAVIPFPFEAVLTDMMMPMSQYTLDPRVFNYKEQVAYGFIIALRATLCGAKFVAMVTDTNHHMGAMSAAIDHLSDAYYRKEGFQPNFLINGAKVMFVHAPFITDIVAGKEVYERKDWGRVLADLTS